MIPAKRNKFLLVIIWICSILMAINLTKRFILKESEHLSRDYLKESEHLSTDYLEATSFSLLPTDEQEKEYVEQEPFSSTDLSCACKQDQLPSQNLYEKLMNQKMNWLNLTTMEYLARDHPNFPTSILPLLMKGKCHLIPPPHRMLWSNIYWQRVVVEDTTFNLYSAFIDNRPLTKKRPVVLILVSTMSLVPRIPWCYLWFNASGPPVISSIIKRNIHKRPARNFYANPYLLECPVPKGEAHRKPLAVSLVWKPCMKANNLLEVNGDLQRSHATLYREGIPPSDDDGSGYSIAACGTTVYYYTEDFSTRLVEWLEILRAIGFSRVFLHEMDIHPNISKVFRYYEKDGFLGVTKYTFPEPILNEPSMRWLWHDTEKEVMRSLNQLFFTDCVLRRMHQYRFIAHIDQDEVPMMLKHDSVTSWLDDTVKKATAQSARNKKPMPVSYLLKWRDHYSDLALSDVSRGLPEYLWNLRHSKAFSPPGGVKSLYDMSTVTSVSAHRVVTCSGKCASDYSIPISVAYLGHFKGVCGARCQKPRSVTEFNFLLQQRHQIEEAVTKVLKKLELI